MYVDYIHYYSKNDLSVDPAPELNIDEETIGQIISPDKAQHAFNSSLSQFPDIELKSFGAGGEPEIFSSSNAIDGDSSLVFSYPGGTWGGGWFELETPVDLSVYADGNLIFYLKEPAELSDVELKMEAVSNSSAIFLVSYFPEAVPNGFLKYKIPLNQFVDLDLSEIKVPFSLWNPKDVNGDYPVVDIIVDNIFFEM